MTLLADLLSTVFERRMGFTAPAANDARRTADLAVALVGASGEFSGQAIARQILERYEGKSDGEKLEFFQTIAGTLNIDPARVRDTLAAYEGNPGKHTYRAFMAASEPPRQELIRRLNMVPGATDRLVKMRADLLRLAQDDPALSALDLDFRHLFASWFNRGFLVLRPINWQSPAHILEKIIAYEAVHAIDSWADLRRRLEPPDRRCFAFFHPAMPDEPLIFVEVALTRGVAGSIQTLLAESREITPEADTAVFYSISNCQAGLASISFGNSLIKQVVADLAFERPDLKTFVTLSPIPGLSRWLGETGLSHDPEKPDELCALAAHYLLNAKSSGGLPRDAVARFHLGNGATVHRINAGADTSPKGLAQSGGVMVNYHYDLRALAQNHEAFATKHEIAAAPEVRRLARGAPTPVPTKATP